LLQKVSHSSTGPKGRGVWVPAFAGTTDDFQNSRKHDFAISRLEMPEV
jgi:hypothetical protein